MSTPSPAVAGKSVRPLAALRPFLRPYRGRIALAGLFLMLAALTTLVLPLALRTLLMTGILVPLMVFVLLPALQKTFAGWLRK